MTTRSPMPTRQRSAALRSSVGPMVLLSVVGAALIAGCAADASSPEATQNATQALSTTLPRANLQGRTRRVHGVVATGKTPDAAAERFRQNGAAALGVDPDELTPARLDGAAITRLNAPASALGAAALNAAATPNDDSDANGVGLMYNPATGKYKFRLFTYEQQRDGIPVFRSRMRALVREDGNNPVVWASSNLKPMGSFRAQAGAELRSVDLNKSLEAARASTVPAPTALVNMSTPTPTIFAGNGAETAAPRMAMQYTAKDANGPGTWRFVADATTGDVLHVESSLHFDINGTVRARVTTGPRSIECGELGIASLPYANVTSAAGNALTDKAGAFTINESGSGPLAVVSDLTGKYFYVTDNTGSTMSMSLDVTPPGPANFLHPNTDDPSQLDVAQLNAYKSANEIRDMLLTFVPDYPVIAGQTNFHITVNRTDSLCDRTGGAWYDDEGEPRTLNFCQRTETRANTAFGSLVFHEFGHHVVDSGKSRQNEYGEGMSDTIAMLFSKDPRIAIGYHPDQCDEPLRSAASTCQYSATSCSSCGSGLYECGALLSGTIWDIWKQLDLTEPERSDEIIRSLVFSSVPMHEGSSIDESIAVDLLTLDDNDELLENGTPHYQEICTGFALHGMNCPPIVDGLVAKGVDLESKGLSDGPFEPGFVSYRLYNLGPQDNLSYSVRIPSDARWLTVDKTGGTIALGAYATVTVSIDQAQAALLADGNYSAMIDFVNETSGVGTVSRREKLRVGAPSPIYTATFSGGLDDFAVGTEDGNLWHASTACVDALPGHTLQGILYYGKDSTCSYTSPVPILHTVTSPVITIANPGMTELGFHYFLTTENNPQADDADVLLSVDGNAFQIVASNNKGGQKLNETRAWQELRFDVSELLPATGPTRIQLQVAFNAKDRYSNTKTGFAMDDITVYAKPAPVGEGPCAAYCTNPIAFSNSSYQSGDLGTNATCHETTAPLRGGVCGNFVGERKLFVNGVAMKCDWAPWSSLPPAEKGGYCISTTGGDHRWAAFTTW